MKRLSIAILLTLSFLSLQAQELTNAGREFWVTSSVNLYSDIMPDSALIYIIGDTPCTGYIENPNTSFYQTFTVVPDSVLVIAVPKDEIMCNVPTAISYDTSRTIEQKGVYINSTQDVFVYMQTNCVDSVLYIDTALYATYGKQSVKLPIIPLNLHSSEVRLNDPYSFVNTSANGTNCMMIIATENNTVLHVPTFHNSNGSIYTFPFDTTLQKGEVLYFPLSLSFHPNDTNKIITTSNCKKIVTYFCSYTTAFTLDFHYGKRFKSTTNKHLYYGKDFLLVKYVHPNFQKELYLNFSFHSSSTGNYLIYRCNQLSSNSLLNIIAVDGRLNGCEQAFPPFLIDVPFAFYRSDVDGFFSNNCGPHVHANYKYYLTHTSTGQFWQKYDNCEVLPFNNKNYLHAADRMVKKWLFPTTQRRIFPIPDTTYADLQIFVKPEGIHTMYINHQLIPSTAFDTFPQTNGDYYYLQYGLFNDSIPDFFILENENGFSATIDEFGYNMRPDTTGHMNFLYFHNNDSGVNYYESPVAYSNLSPVDSATVYRCVGDLLHLEVPHNPDSVAIDWIVDGTLYPNSPTVDYPLTTAGTLTVQLVLHYTCPDTTTTFVVVVPPPVIPFSTDTILCQGTELSAETPDAIHYLWSTGDTTASIVIDTAGVYSVSVTNLGCTVSLNDINVQLYPQSSVNLGNDSILCALATLLLNAEQTHPATYLWQDLSTNTTYLVDFEGDYWVIVTDECLQVSDTIYLGYLYPIEVDLGNDTTLCDGQHLLLSAETPYCTYLWQDGSTEATYLVRYAGVYQVLVSNLCFDETAEIEVFYQRCEQELYIPNSFTPNSDGLNDQFKPIFAYPDKIEEYSIYIYNRWGNLLFTSQNPEQGWTGEGCMNGVYTYVIFYKTEGKGGKVVNGTVTIY